MRRHFLLRSVERLLPPGERPLQVAFLWSRHRWMPLFGFASFVALTAVATMAGFETWLVRIAVGIGGAAVAATATSSYWVLARTTSGLVWMGGSRIRQRATRLLDRLPPSTEIARVGGSMLASEWSIGHGLYSVSRSYDRELQQLVAGRR